MRTALCLASVAIVASSKYVQELHADSFFELIRDQEHDHVVYFADSLENNNEGADVALSLVTSASDILHSSPSEVSISLYDLGAHGAPAGLHLHSLPAIVLFPAGGREPILFEGAHSHHDGHGHDHHDHGDHSTCSDAAHHHDHDFDRGSVSLNDRVIDFLRWLSEHATFGKEIPVFPDAKWHGREDAVISAITNGLGVLQRRIKELTAKNEELSQALSACRAASKGGASTCSASASGASCNEL